MTAPKTKLKPIISIQGLVERIKVFIRPDKDEEFERRAELVRLEACIELIKRLHTEAYILSDEGRDKIADELNELRKQYSVLYRRLKFADPPTEEGFLKTLYWIVENGAIEDLLVIQQIKKSPPYRSEEIELLFETAERRIRERADASTSELRCFLNLTQEEYKKLIEGNETSVPFPSSSIIQKLCALKESLKALIKPDKIKDWLRTPNPGFGGKSPHDLIVAGEIDRVLEVLAGLEDGVHN